MADVLQQRGRRDSPSGARTTRARLTPYRAVLASRMRSQRSYRSNFVIDLGSSFVVGFVELAEVWMLFRNVSSLGGFTFAQILLVFGLADFCYSIADMVMGHCDNLPVYLRAGTLDVFYLRPQPLLLQLITSDISLRRIARALVGLGALVIGMCINDIHWSPAHVGLLAMAIVCGTAIYAAMYAWAAGAQFFLVQGAEMTNAFVYGGRYASTQVAAVWSRPLKVLFGFFFPMAMTAYVPCLRLLGLPGPEWLPSWLAWCIPGFAIWIWTLALVFWRLGVRHYQGAGG